MFYILSLIIFLIDQTFKVITNHYLFINESVPIVENIFHLTYVQNRGAAFGIFNGWRALLLLIGFAVVAIIIYIYIKCRMQPGDYLTIALAFILGGSLSNLYDRVVRGYVIDYVDFRIWPVFNLADLMINLGVIIIFVKLILGSKGKHVS